MPIETRIQAAVNAALAPLHAELHEVVASLHKRIAVLEQRAENLTNEGPDPRPRRGTRTGKPAPTDLPAAQ